MPNSAIFLHIEYPNMEIPNSERFFLSRILNPLSLSISWQPFIWGSPTWCPFVWHHCKQCTIFNQVNSRLCCFLEKSCNCKSGQLGKPNMPLVVRFPNCHEFQLGFQYRWSQMPWRPTFVEMGTQRDPIFSEMGTLICKMGTQKAHIFKIGRNKPICWKNTAKLYGDALVFTAVFRC